LSYHGKPSPSVLVRMGGPLQAPRRWYGSQLCVAVLTKDDWLHCFRVSMTKSDNSKAKLPASAPTSSTTYDGATAEIATSSSANGPTGGTANHGGNNAGIRATHEDVSENGFDALDAMEDEPHWSMHLPGASVTASVNGRPQCFEVEEVRRGFLGIRNAKRELLQAESAEGMRSW